MTVKLASSSTSKTKDIKPKNPVKTAKKKRKVNNVVDPQLREQMIAEAAYFKALGREFRGDYCMEDWLEAEKEIDASINDE